MRPRFGWNLLGCLLLASSSCLFGSTTSVEYTGRHVSAAAMQEIDVGSSQEEVLEVFGEPSSRRTDGEEEVWVWRYARQTKKAGSVFLILGTSSRTTHHGTVNVRFREGKVTRLWRTGV